MRLGHEVALVLAVQAGLLDALALPDVDTFRDGLEAALERRAGSVVRAIEANGTLDESGRAALLAALAQHARAVKP
jgi:F-type H+/Na+-transporting ATPase subunit alpha